MNKRLFLASILLLIAIFGVATFNLRANATDEPTPAPSSALTEAPTPIPSASPEPTNAEISQTPAPTEIAPTISPTTMPSPTTEVIEEEDAVQGAQVSAPNVQVVNNNNNTNTNNNEQRIYLEAPQITNVTSGGNPVYEEPYYIEESPSTGPESLSLLGLLPTGIVGYLLRRKFS
jgi:cytoskeletal protein RodZ